MDGNPCVTRTLGKQNAHYITARIDNALGRALLKSRNVCPKYFRWLSVTCSFGHLLVYSNSLNRQSNTLTDTDTHRAQSTLAATGFQLIQGRRD